MKLLDRRPWLSKACALPARLHPLGVSLPLSCQAAPLYLPWVLEALAAASDVLLGSAPLGPCARTGPWGGTVASAHAVPVGKLGDSLAGFPHRGSVGGADMDMQKFIMLSSHQRERCGGRQSSEDVPTAFCLHLPMVAGAGCFPRAVLHPGPALGHTKIRSIFFCHHPAPPNGPVQVGWAVILRAESWGLVAGAVSQELLLESVMSCSVLCS